MTTENLLNKKSGVASESDIASLNADFSSLLGTTWNYQITFNNGNIGSGEFIFEKNGVCIIQALKPNPTWWQVQWSETGDHFTMTEKGSGSSFATYSGSHYNGKGSGSYVVNPPDASQDAVFTMAKV